MSNDLLPDHPHHRRAGGSALARFREKRREKIRANWRDWAMLISVLAGSLIVVIATAGILQLVFAGLVGALGGTSETL
jgi:hypothetical protein